MKYRVICPSYSDPGDTDVDRVEAPTVVQAVSKVHGDELAMKKATWGMLGANIYLVEIPMTHGNLTYYVVEDES